MKYILSALFVLAVLVSSGLIAMAQGPAVPELPEVGYACRESPCDASDFDADTLFVERAGYSWERAESVPASPDLRDIYWCKGEGCFLPIHYSGWDGVSEYSAMPIAELEEGDTAEVLVVDFNEEKVGNILQLVNDEVLESVTVGGKIKRFAPYTATSDTSLTLRHRDTLMALVRVVPAQVITVTPEPTATNTPTSTSTPPSLFTPVPSTATAVSTVTPTVTSTSTTAPTATPEPTSTPMPTQAPTMTPEPTETLSGNVATPTPMVPTSIDEVVEPSMIFLPIVQ